MELNFKKMGEGKPLVVLHGLLGSLDNWQSIAKELSSERLIYSLDLRNHGKSPHHPDFGYDVMVEDLFDFFDQQFISTATILGHSMGGKVAMSFALRYPRMVEKLVVADIAPVAYKAGHDAVFRALRLIPIEKMSKRSEVEEALRMEISEEHTVQFLLKGLTRDERQLFCWRFNVSALWNNYANIISGIDNQSSFNKDVLFLKGELSDYIQTKDEPVMKRLFPNYRLETVLNAGHWLHADQPAAFVEAVRRFI